MAKQIAPVEVDFEATENDSTYGADLSTYTASLTSSVFDYRQENGRRYHGYRDGSYLLPNDEKESDRLDMIHQMMSTLMDGKLFHAPIGKSPQHVLDLGTGTGIWAIDFADLFPSAEVIGTDLSPTQPTFVPPNLRFIIDDMEDEWLYGNQTFDFIHARFLAGSIKNYQKLLRSTYENTTPGGWVEFQDWDFNNPSEDGSTKDTTIEQYYKVVLGAFTKAGYVTSPGPQLEGWFREAGFEDIHVKTYRIPLGTWTKSRKLKTVGAWNLVQAETGFAGGAMAVLTRHDSWKPEEVSILAAKALNDARDPDIHALFPFYVVWGRKPQ